MKTRSALAALTLAPWCALAFAQTAPSPADFTVGDIRVEGLQRVSEGTVYNYLPVNIGDHLTAQRVREAIRALYATGFFRDVQLRRDGSTLIVVVLERPSIESFEITGNKDIKTEDLQKSLRNVGLATGKTFDRSVLEDVTQYLTDQYFARGKYGVKIDSHVEEEAGNRVKVKIEIKEGARAKIRQINIVGASRFPQKEILQTLELKTPNWLSWYRQDDRYSRESLQGDLEKVRNFYMDRGYANFQLDSTQVAITPEKEDIFITVNINEGQVYKVSQIKLAGTFVVPQRELEQLLLIHPGATFNRKLITSSQELMQNRMGRDGYAFAKVEPVPTADNANHTVSLTFFVDPGNRVYVRNISFSGANRVNDEVLRREMRQLEGGWLSNTSLERSKQRIQRLPYVKSVEFETTPVAGSPDLVDVSYKIEEGPASQLSGGIGYSETYRFMLNGSYADADFLGTGQRIAVNLNGGAFSKVYSVSHTNPYTNIDNLQRTISVSYSDVTHNTYVIYGSNFKSVEPVTGWDWDTRNRTPFADRGMRHSLSFSATVPGSDVKYWIGNYTFLRYVPVYRALTLSFLAGVDYGAPLGSTTAIPPYRQFFGGGPDSVRGFRESRLGPKDQFGNPYGGNFRIVSQNELILPMPSKWAQTARVSAFFDIGNVFQTGNKLQFFGPDGSTVDNYHFSTKELKRSVGLAVQWLAPLGLFRFSFGVPLNPKHGDPQLHNWRDETDGVQYWVGYDI